MALPAGTLDRARAACEAALEESKAVRAVADPGRLGSSVGGKLRAKQVDAAVVILSSATELMEADTVLGQMTVELQEGITAAHGLDADSRSIVVLVEALSLQTRKVRSMSAELEKLM